jgi:3-oxoacyl-[acyl-carrier protein] reductase
MRAASKTMMRQRSGKIINMASVIGLIGNAGQANYAASKAGIIALTKSVAKELGSRNVLVNAIAPGFIETEMTNVLGDDVKKAILKSIPAGRFGSPADVAKTALYLASDESNFVTGQVITVDGGMVM